MKLQKQFLFVLVATSLVLGCGYKLRAWDLSKNIDSIFVQSKTNSPIDDSLSLALGRAGVLLVENPKDADVVVSLGNYTRSRRTASVNRRASAADYQLSLQISYEVLKGGKRILGPQIARAYRVYRVDRENIVGGSEEEVLLETEMKSDLVQQVIRAINAVTQESESGAIKAN